MERKKVAVYLRIGNADVKQLDIQEKLVQDYCDKKGYEIALIYKDINISANDSKKSLEDLFEELIDNNDINKIVVQDLARLSRNIFDLYDYVKYADEMCFCDIETVNQGMDYKFSINLSKGVLDYE